MNKTILKSDFIICDEIIQNSAICFDTHILKIGKFELLCEKYPDAEIKILPKNSVLMPGLINTHVHLEFSANKSILKYGDFITWLKSVIKNRESLVNELNHELITKQINFMIKTGTLSFGEISSYMLELEECAKTPANVVFFNEILGTNEQALDILYNDFLNRLESTKNLANDSLIPAISVHSPYSTHPILAKKALNIARNENLLNSTHFLESNAEFEWLKYKSGDFKNFLSNFIKNPKPLILTNEFLSLFDGVKSIFAHCCYANKEELEIIKNLNASISSCAFSNRLLGNQRLNLKNVVNNNLTFATDGLSSNLSLSLWDELRAVLGIYHDENLSSLSKFLIKCVTKNAAIALNLNNGELKEKKAADIIGIILPQSSHDIYLDLILHTNEVDLIYIKGKYYDKKFF